MKKISSKKFLINYFNIILVNFLFADSNIIIQLIATFFSHVCPFVASLHEFLEKYYHDFNNIYDDIIFAYVDNFLTILIILILLLKLLVLPIFYNMLETRSKNVRIIKFIKNLKSKFGTKLLVLFLSIIPFLIWNKLNYSLFKKEVWFNFLVFCIISGLFGSYLILFLFWEVEKWWRRYGSNRFKSTKIYLKINEIFNKIQNFNYRNFQKCQKKLLFIINPFCKIARKIKKILKIKIF